MNVVAYVSELMDRSKVQAALPGTTFAHDAAVAAEADVVVVDLTLFGDAVAGIRAAAPRARIVAYGPHVDAELLRRAGEDGADMVLPRSQFFRDPHAAVTDS